MILGHDDDLDRKVRTGLWCSECSAEFTKPHGFPVACHYCYKHLSFHDRTQVRKSTHKEVNRQANEDLGRERKKQRMARNVDKG